jgi:hypothetical protein
MNRMNFVCQERNKIPCYNCLHCFSKKLFWAILRMKISQNGWEKTFPLKKRYHRLQKNRIRRLNMSDKCAQPQASSAQLTFSKCISIGNFQDSGFRLITPPWLCVFICRFTIWAMWKTLLSRRRNWQTALMFLFRETICTNVGYSYWGITWFYSTPGKCWKNVVTHVSAIRSHPEPEKLNQ